MYVVPLSTRRLPTNVPRPSDFDRLIKPLLEREALDLDDAGEMELDDEIAEIKQDREDALAEQKK